MNMPRACIFCDGPLTGVRAKEHGIPKWLMEYLGIKEATDGLPGS